MGPAFFTFSSFLVQVWLVESQPVPEVYVCHPLPKTESWQCQHSNRQAFLGRASKQNAMASCLVKFRIKISVQITACIAAPKPKQAVLRVTWSWV